MKAVILLLVVLVGGCGKGAATNDSSSGTLIQTDDTKTCYWCKESIKAAALVCKHCGKNPLSPSTAQIEKHVRFWAEKPDGVLTKADLAKVTDLKKLDNNQLTDISALAELPNLEELDLHSNPLPESQLKHLTGLTKLTYLDLGGLKITDAGLKELPKLKQLTELRLDDTQITDAGLKEVAKMKQLERLKLFGTKVTKGGVAELQKALPNCNISSNPTK